MKCNRGTTRCPIRHEPGGMSVCMPPINTGEERAPERIADDDARQSEASVSDEACAFCGEPCDSLAANPGLWPVRLSHPDGTGLVRWHHHQCVVDRLFPRANKPLLDEEPCRAAERLRIITRMRTEYPMNRHAREWADWIEEEGATDTHFESGLAVPHTIDARVDPAILVAATRPSDAELQREWEILAAPMPIVLPRMNDAPLECAPWMTVINREQDVEALPWADEESARNYFDPAQTQWSESWLCRVVIGPRDTKGMKHQAPRTDNVPPEPCGVAFDVGGPTCNLPKGHDFHSSDMIDAAELDRSADKAKSAPEDILDALVFQIDQICKWLEGRGYGISAMHLHHNRNLFLLPQARLCSETDKPLRRQEHHFLECSRCHLVCGAASDVGNTSCAGEQRPHILIARVGLTCERCNVYHRCVPEKCRETPLVEEKKR